MFSSIMSFDSETKMKAWFQKKYSECGRTEFEKWLRTFFERSGEVYVDAVPCGYWACWGAGVLGERPVADRWEIELADSWSTSEIKNRIWGYVSSGQPVPGCVSLLALRMVLLIRGESPYGYHDT